MAQVLCKVPLNALHVFKEPTLKIPLYRVRNVYIATD